MPEAPSPARVLAQYLIDQGEATEATKGSSGEWHVYVGTRDKKASSQLVITDLDAITSAPGTRTGRVNTKPRVRVTSYHANRPKGYLKINRLQGFIDGMKDVTITVAGSTFTKLNAIRTTGTVHMGKMDQKLHRHHVECTVQLPQPAPVPPPA